MGLGWALVCEAKVGWSSEMGLFQNRKDNWFGLE